MLAEVKLNSLGLTFRLTFSSRRQLFVLLLLLLLLLFDPRGDTALGDVLEAGKIIRSDRNNRLVVLVIPIYIYIYIYRNCSLMA